jgi:adenine-specific DNA-methyltransferase
MPTLEWIGKDKVINHHLDVPYQVLEEKYTFNTSETSENKIVKGDNLAALKSLLPEYEGKIKCIYIDPPYNTGNEGWCYNDNVNDPKIKKWLGEVVGKEGEDLSRHDKWLCMMYPRLKLLQKLLSDDGAIFISIDDNEQANLKLICDEIFGSGNFIAEFIWKSKLGKVGTAGIISTIHEYIICYAKNKNIISFSKIETENNGRRENLRQWGQADNREDRPSMYYPITIDGLEVYPIKEDGKDGRWRVSKDTAEKLKESGELELSFKNGKYNIYRIFPSGVSITTYNTLLLDEIGTTANGTKRLKRLGLSNSFNYPKSVELIEHLIMLLANPNDIILDSFAGSGTTAHAVLNLNKEDGGNRKFILVEMEDYAENTTAERVRRVIKGYADVEGTGGDFTFYELGDRLLDESGNLNEHIELEKIRDYIWYMETHTKLPAEKTEDSSYYLGTNRDTAYYFAYEKGKLTDLNYDLLAQIKTKADNYVIYADTCTLSETELIKYNISFRKIPRDITKL